MRRIAAPAAETTSQDVAIHATLTLLVARREALIREIERDDTAIAVLREMAGETPDVICGREGAP